MTEPQLLFGIGAQKAASTWLHSQLKSHAQVHIPEPKELHYWDTIRPPLSKQHRIMARFRDAEARRFSRAGPLRGLLNTVPPAARELRARHKELLEGETPGHVRYLSYLRDGMDAQTKVVAEITPSYALLSASTFAEMAALAGGAKFLFILRDPVMRLVSGLRHSLRSEIGAGHVDLDRFRKIFDESLEMGLANDAFARSTYDATLGRLDEAVPADRVLVLFYETMFSAAAMEHLADFLGLSPIDAQFKTQVYKTKNDEFVPTSGQLEAARRAFASVYDDVSRRYGDRVPAEWGDLSAEEASQHA